jgi:hypothetical protein
MDYFLPVFFAAYVFGAITTYLAMKLIALEDAS